MTVERINRPEPPLHPVWRALLYVVLLAMLSGVGAYALGLFERWVPDWMQRAIPQLPDTDLRSPVMGLGYVWMFTGATLLATGIMTAVVERRPLRSVGLQWGRRSGRDVGLGLALGVALQTGILGIAWLCGWANVRAGGPVRDAILLGVLLFVPAALNEELSVRGYLLPTLGQSWGGRTALVVTSVLFGALHCLNPGASPLAFLGTTAAGVLLGLAYQWTGRLWLPWALHFAWNFAEGSLWGMPVSGLLAPSVVRTRLHGPALWTGGEFGPEAGLLGLLAVILGTWVLARSIRRRVATDEHR